MNYPTAIKDSRKIVFLLCLALIASAVVRLVQAEAPPKFASPEVNDYVTKQTELMDTYIAALKEGDQARKDDSSKAMSENQDKNMFTVSGKLTGAEKPAYDKWVKSEGDRMAAAILASLNK